MHQKTIIVQFNIPQWLTSMAIVKVTSHRSREKLQRLIGKTQGYFSWKRRGSWYECPDDKLEEVLKIKGIKKSKLKSDLKPYINW